MNVLHEFLLFNLFVVGGVFVEFVIFNPHFFSTGHWKKKYHFSIFRYTFLLLFPFIGFFILLHRIGPPVGTIFVVSCAMGTLLEWCIGSSYHAIVGQRLWTYHRLSFMGDYSSVLSIPIWGLAGIYFWLLFQVIG